jgi:hypothetical protein
VNWLCGFAAAPKSSILITLSAFIHSSSPLARILFHPNSTADGDYCKSDLAFFQLRDIELTKCDGRLLLISWNKLPGRSHGLVVSLAEDADMPEVF